MYLVYYNGAHSAKIGNKDTWTDWHLIPSSKIVIAPPAVKTKVVDIPGANGQIDLTTVLTGYPTYSNRTGSMEFILAPGFLSWENSYSEITNYLHGNTFQMILDDDPGFYYTGMFTVNGYKSDKSLNSITINYDLYPFKKDISATDEPWLWDPFNFDIGIIHDYNEMTVSGSLVVEIPDCTEPVMPVVTLTSAMTIRHDFIRNGEPRYVTYSVSAGTSRPGFVLGPGINTLTITGNGKITISYRGGRL